MPLQYDPEFALAIAPIAELLASRPKFPAGDALSRREAVNTFLKQMYSSIPENPNIKRTDHIFKSHDGAELVLAEFRNPSTRTKSSEAGGNGRGEKAVYYIHGGGMILGSLDVFEKGIVKKAEEFGCPVFAVGYRLAPEFPHPTPVGDCFEGLKWLSAHAAELGVDPARILVMGESAGGGLAAGTCLMARDFALQPPVAKQILIFPMLDDRNLHPDPQLEPFAVWSCDDNITGWKALLGDKAGSADPKAVSPYAAPARAETVAGLPPTYMDCGQLDIFIEEDTKFALRLIEAKVPVDFHVYPGMPHAFQGYAPQASYSKCAAENVLRAVAQV